MADSREIGMRVGAATNQAVSVAVSIIDKLGGGDPDVVRGYVETLAGDFLGVMDRLQQSVTGQQPAPQQQRAAQPQWQPASAPPVTEAQAVSNVQAAFGGTTVTSTPAGYNTQFSGSNKPLKLAEHPELDGWLHAQCAAVGVHEVWDNRGKPAYIQAINTGNKKTPPPFRSATEGIDKSFWPPN